METCKQRYPLFVGVAVKKDCTESLEEVKQAQPPSYTVFIYIYFFRGELEAPLTETGLK